jgi:hypothetical protein
MSERMFRHMHFVHELTGTLYIAILHLNIHVTYM